MTQLARHLLRHCATVLMMSCAAPVPAAADDYPGRSVRIIVPFPPGSGTDIIGRIVGQTLSDAWKQPFVVDNRPGAGGTIGSDIVAKAPPDGHTLLVTSGAHTVNPAFYPKLPYDPVSDFA